MCNSAVNDGRSEQTAPSSYRGAIAGVIDITEGKRAEETLRESEEFLRLAIEATGGGTYTYDFTSGKGCWSTELKNLFGLGPDDPLPLDADLVPVVLHPEDRSAYLAARTASCDPRGDGIIRFEYRIFHSDGSVRWLQINGRTSFTGEGENRHPSRTAGIVTDITERKRAEEALREANAYNRTLIETSLDPIMTVGLDGKFMDVNHAAEEMFGYTREQLIGTDCADCFTDSERAREGYRQVFRDGQVRDFALDIKHRNGSVTSVLFNASTYKDGTGQVVGLIAVARDITNRKKAEEESRRAREQWERTFDAVPDLIAILDQDKRVVRVNRAMANRLGVSREECIGQFCHQLLHGTDAAPETCPHRPFVLDGC